MTRTLTIAAMLAVSGCADIQTLGASAIQHRQVMNDLQTRASLHALCDISIGSYFRELRGQEKRFVAGICSGGEVERLEASE